MTENNFNLKRFSHGILLDCSIENLCDHITRADGFTKWFIGEAVYDAEGRKRNAGEYLQSGDKFRWKWRAKDFEISGEIISVEKKSEIYFSFGGLHEVKITLEKRDRRSYMRLEQYYKPGAVPNDFVHISCAVCWVFFMTNLKSVIENGIDLRETESDDEELVNR